MQRRDFLKTTMSGAAGVLAAGPLSAGGDGTDAEASAEQGVPDASRGGSRIEGRLAEPRLRLSLAAYSFRNQLQAKEDPLTLEAFIDYCARQGLDGTELTSYYFPRTDRDFLTSLKRRAIVNGLTITGTPIGNDFCVEPGAAFDEQLAKAKAWVDHAGVLGAQTIRVFAGRAPKGVSAKLATERAIAGLRQLADYAAEKGVLLALENHGGVTATADGLLRIVESVASPWLGINLDTGNFHQDVYESLERVAPYAVSVQVKAETREGKAAPVETDWSRVVALLQKASYRGFLALEYEGREDVWRAVPEGLEKLRRAIELG